MVSGQGMNRVSLGAAVLGVVLLLFASEAIEPKKVKIAEISEAMEGTPITVDARVVSRGERNGTIFLRLYDGTAGIKAVLFRPDERQREIIGKGFASFEGKVQVYREELEIVVERVGEWE